MKIIFNIFQQKYVWSFYIEIIVNRKILQFEIAFAVDEFPVWYIKFSWKMSSSGSNRKKNS